MKLGVVVDGGHAFIGDLLADWNAHFKTEVFSHPDIRSPLLQERLNRWRLRQALRRFLQTSDVVFFEWAGPLLVMASRLPTKAKVVVRLHSFELYEFAPSIRWESVDRIVLVSHAMKKRFCDLYPGVADRTTVVYHGKAMDKFRPQEHPFAGVIGMLGNLVPIKRVYETILAVYELSQCGYHFTLRLGGLPGQGADAERYNVAIRRLVCELGLEHQVMFDGQITNTADYLSQIDVFVSNSFWEGQQNALIEAMATGCYCLSHFWAGAEEILPPENLFVTDRQLREKIIAYGSLSEAARRDLQSNMRAIAKDKFDQQRIAGVMRDVIQSVTAA